MRSKCSGELPVGVLLDISKDKLPRGKRSGTTTMTMSLRVTNCTDIIFAKLSQYNPIYPGIAKTVYSSNCYESSLVVLLTMAWLNVL